MRAKLILVAFLFLNVNVQAEELAEIFKKVTEFRAQGKIPQALTELEWAKKELEKDNLKQIQAFFPDTLEGFTGQKLEANSAMGFSNIERRYKRAADNASVKVSLTGTSQGSGLGGLAGFAQMAGMMQQGPDDETFRVGDLTAILHLDRDAKSAELTVSLKNGSILKLDMDRAAEGETLKKMLNAIDATKLNSYFAG